LKKKEKGKRPAKPAAAPEYKGLETILGPYALVEFSFPAKPKGKDLGGMKLHLTFEADYHALTEGALDQVARLAHATGQLSFSARPDPAAAARAAAAAAGKPEKASKDLPGQMPLPLPEPGTESPKAELRRGSKAAADKPARAPRKAPAHSEIK
jgi:hypothetical protein